MRPCFIPFNCLYWSRMIVLSDYNLTWNHNHLVRKRKLNHLAKLAKWLSCVVSTHLYGAFDCMFLSAPYRYKYSQRSSIIWPVWLNGWVFESSSSHLNFRFCPCFEQGFSWHSGNYRVWIRSETHTWFDSFHLFIYLFFIISSFYNFWTY